MVEKRKNCCAERCCVSTPQKNGFPREIWGWCRLLLISLYFIEIVPVSTPQNFFDTVEICPVFEIIWESFGDLFLFFHVFSRGDRVFNLPLHFRRSTDGRHRYIIVSASFFYNVNRRTDIIVAYQLLGLFFSNISRPVHFFSLLSWGFRMKMPPMKFNHCTSIHPGRQCS